MLVYVHSTNRHDLKTGTLQALHEARINPCIACPAGEEAAYREAWPLCPVYGFQARQSKTLPLIQDAIMGHAKPMDDKVLLLDDDLKFYAREPGTKRRHLASGEELRRMVWHLRMALDHNAHAGIMVNKDIGLQDVHPETTTCGPMRSVLGYRKSILTNHGIIFRDTPESKSDYHVALSLYEAGFQACILRNYGHEQCGGPDLPGGNTPYRDEAMHARAAHRLAELHPEFVSVVEKRRKGWSFTRTDVRVQWQKAMAHGQEVGDEL